MPDSCDLDRGLLLAVQAIQVVMLCELIEDSLEILHIILHSQCSFVLVSGVIGEQRSSYYCWNWYGMFTILIYLSSFPLNV